ncbi:Lantibiotic dehydratase-like protein [Pedobacter sp. BAL39]|uniref:lantibiotic dehydratase n=1 Tax=Pedobacter sp. BAL39 TaxID=391596 RepID=UPI000155A1C1|nr:lantibiotic dehydratase [Pedobacter sp. BAL39]EDM38454.1 Lantibiotic dehydratase-like protein [Pedobacter sp. BAL39]
MKIDINQTLLLRIPAFSLSDQLVQVWETLKEAISQSSPEFYLQIASLDAEGVAGADFKTQYTIWKYFNRSKFRGTPYGSFAGIAVASLSSGAQQNITLSNRQCEHRFRDWSSYSNVSHLVQDLNATERVYFANTSTYVADDAIRFIAFQEKSFELAEIERSIFIEALLDFCTRQVTYQEVLLFAERHSVEQEVLLGIINALLELQLIFTDLDRNIIGEDYFERNALPSASFADKSYIIAERNVLEGGVDARPLKHLRECIAHLSRISPTAVNEDMATFIREFKRRYDGLEVPLLTVLDPEFGIGYAAMDGLMVSDVVDELAGVGEVYTNSATMTPLATWILKEMLRSKDANHTIMIQDADIQLQPAAVLPNTISALVSYAGNQIVIEQLGGSSSNALAGRFSIASEQVKVHCKQMAAIEASANPEVIFFDIGYMAEEKVDNINRRASIYDYELCVLNYSCSKHPIAINDLVVTVRNDEIILMSGKYHKRVVPRMASAYNYSRSDLSLFKFLCDLQHQGLQTQLLPDLRSLLPGLDFYPRMQYQNIILSTAKWRLNHQLLSKDQLRDELSLLGVSRYIRTGKTDQTLVFDLDHPTELGYLRHYLNREKDIMVEEVLLSEQQIFKDGSGKEYLAQTLLSICHHEQIYQPVSPDPQLEIWLPKSRIFPGKDWLYLEIYCHPAYCDRLLTGVLNKFISVHGQDFLCWFFIRYTDPLAHIRLRVQMKHPSKSHLYLSDLLHRLGPDMDSGRISDLQIKTYMPEYARYGTQQMKLTEAHFMADSDYILTLLDQEDDPNRRYRSCAQMMCHVLERCIENTEERLELVKQVKVSFEEEHKLSSSEFKKINKEWKFFRELMFQKMSDVPSPAMASVIDSFCSVIAAASVSKKRSVISALFHMHINRYFASHQRTHELMIYSFLYKYMAEGHRRLIQV